MALTPMVNRLGHAKASIINYTCCSHSGSEDDPDQNNFQKNFTKI